MEQLMTRSEVMDVVRVSDPKTLLRWIRDGGFPAGIGTGRQQLWAPTLSEHGSRRSRRSRRER